MPTGRRSAGLVSGVRVVREGTASRARVAGEARRTHGEGVSFLRRLVWYREQGKPGRGFVAAQAAEALEVSERTFYRDRQRVDEFGAELQFDRGRRRWFWHGGDVVPRVRLTEGEAFALLVADEVLARYDGTPYGESLRSAFARLLPLLDTPLELNLAALANDPSLPRFTGPPVRPLPARQFAQLASACRERRRLEMRYFTAGTNEERTRRVDPYHLFEYGGDWYFVAHDHYRGEPRTFALGDRIRSLQETGERFEPDPAFDLDAYMADGFGLFRGGTVEEVVLRFAASAAPYVQERTWAPSERKEALPCGGVRLRIRVPVNVGLERFVLQWGCEVVVEAPGSLWHWHIAELSAALAEYRAAEEQNP